MSDGTYFAALWETGTDANYYSIGLSLQKFGELATERHKKGLRLVDIETYFENGQRVWAGVWRAGNWANYYSVDLSLQEFNTLATERHKKGLRLIDIETYVEGGQRLWAGLWQTGDWANYYSVDLSLQDLNELATERHKKGLRLIDIETYVQNGQRLWAGLWRTGDWANYYSVKLDAEKLGGLARERHAKQLRIVSIEAYSSGCDSKCLNQVVLPAQYTDDNGEVHKDETYVYWVTGHSTAYRWPVDEDDGKRFARVSTLSMPDRFLTLPFNDSAVKRLGIWRYGNGVWHHAGDFSKGPETFKVRASADGKVTFVGWDDWSGNTVIVSHDVGGVTDAYRTIYMHLRNGPKNDCQQSWTRSVPYVAAMNDADLLAKYKQHLDETGCKENPNKRDPDPNYWGTDAHKIPVSVNDAVKAGDLIAHAGMTGPGGQKKPGPPNTHLHIFWTVRDPKNGEFYFFDPYALYTKPDCYPTGVTDAINGNCARYPIAWKGNKPSYPS
jgi:hypothetical protein